MSNECCKEFKGWCKSFTKTEIALVILEILLLVIFIAFLVFLILHLIVCLKTEKFNDIDEPDITTKASDNTNLTSPTSQNPPADNTTLDPMIECTWKASEKTVAISHYYENDQVTTPLIKQSEIVDRLLDKEHELQSTANGPKYKNYTTELPLSSHLPSAKLKKGNLLALVKLKLPQDVTFGCVLTIISDYWTLTAASCIESIEEVDAVDSFVMMEGYVGNQIGRTFTLSDILIHPEYHGNNKKYDVAALKSEDSLINKNQKVLYLPTMLEIFLLTIGEHLSLIGYGRSSFEIREVSVFTVAGGQCAVSWAPRHLVDKGALIAGNCGLAPLCVVALETKGDGHSTCEKFRCAGAPLIRDNMVLGFMDAACGEPCTPSTGANAALIVEWLRSVLAGD